MRYVDGPRPRIFAHRGASAVAPENTLTAFRLGLELGADRLELDVHATRDGHIVVLHDPTLERTTNGAGRVCDVSLDELERLDAGYTFRDASGERAYRGRGEQVPTLARVLEAFPGVPLNIDVKQTEPPIEERVIAALDRYGARQRALLAAEDDSVMQRIRNAAPDVLTGFTANEVLTFLRDGHAESYRAPGFALQVPSAYQGVPIVTERSVELAHARGLEVHVWTINDEIEMVRLFHLGVDGIITDVPDRAARVREAHRASGR